MPAATGQRPFELVAHRGYAERYPENTREALVAALEAGARWVEFDVQLSADLVPVLCHDADLLRTAGAAIAVADLPWRQLARLEVHEAQRFGERFRGVTMPSLEQAVELLLEWPEVGAFVELKRASLERFGIETTVDRVMQVLAPLEERAVPVSFDWAAVIACRYAGAPRIGWVLQEWVASEQRRAVALAPDFLFCNYRKIPPETTLWPGPWQWVLYEIEDLATAGALAGKGATFLETMRVGALLEGAV